MNNNEMFFGESGIKKTKIDYTLQLAKNMIEKIMAKYSSLQFYNHTTIFYFENRSGEQGRSTVPGMSVAQCRQMVSDYKLLKDLKELVVWLESAEKSRKAMKDEIMGKTEEEVCGILGIEFPEAPVLLVPMTDNEHIATLSIKERNQLYSLQAEASTIGKAVHDNGFMTIARDEFHVKMMEGCTVRESGVHVCFDTYLVEEGTEEAIEELFFSLQNRYREVQARLNSMLHNITEVVREENIRRNEENLRLQSEYETAIADVRERAKNWRIAQILKFDDLCVILPKHLQSTYEELISRKQLAPLKGSWSDITNDLSNRSLD